MAQTEKTYHYRAWFDGCCEPKNPGGTAAFGAVVFRGDEKIWDCSRIFHPKRGREYQTSNNVAEYSGFVAILEFFLEHRMEEDPIEIFGDSMLVICQMRGEWRIKGGFYKPIALRARELFQRFTNTKLTWVPRDQNSIADELSKRELKKAGIEFRIQPEG